MLFTACQNRQEGANAEVVVSIAPIAEMVELLSEGNVAVHCLLPKGGQPESFEPTVQSLNALSDAKVYLSVGKLGFERFWLPRIQELYPKLKLVNLSEGLDVCEQEGEHHHETLGGEEPHYWTSFAGIKHIAGQTAKALSGLNADSSALYMKRLKQFDARLDSLKVLTYNQLSEAKVKAFVIYHPSLTYFAQEMGLEQLVIEDEGKAPNPKHLQELLNKSKDLGVKVVFIQKEFNPKLCESFAQEIGAKTVLINPLGQGWEKEMASITKALTE